MRNLLITGGAGFIGGNFVRYWRRRYPFDRLIVLDALTYAGNRQTIADLAAAGEIVFIHGDIVDASLVSDALGAYQVNTIVHFAAESHVDRSILEPAAFIRTNVDGTQVLLDAARKAWSTDGRCRDGVRFHHVSTDEVYGSLEPEDPPFTEQTPYSPSSPYAASKAASDHLVRAYHHTYGLPVSISNCSNNYGPYHFPEKLIPLMIVNALRGKPLPIYGDGGQVRDWLFVEDHCAAIDRIVHADVAGRTFNVGGRAERKNVDLVRQLCRLIDDRFASDPALAARFPDCPSADGRRCESLMTSVTDRPGHDRRYAIDATRISTELGFEPVYTVESGLAVTVNWYLANEPWWRAVMDGSYREWVERHYGHP